jgi:hypothetical protein
MFFTILSSRYRDGNIWSGGTCKIMQNNGYYLLCKVTLEDRGILLHQSMKMRRRKLKCIFPHTTSQQPHFATAVPNIQGGNLTLFV